jgi:hypothetical protein
MIPKDSRYCAILLVSAQFGQHKIITDYGRELAHKVAGSYTQLKMQLASRFGHEFVIKAGAFQAAVATANLTFNGRGHLMIDARLGTIAAKRQSADGLEVIQSAFVGSDCCLCVICGQKSAFMETIGVNRELSELRSCQALLVYFDQDWRLISTQVFAPEATTFQRDGWRRHVQAEQATKRLAA